MHIFNFYVGILEHHKEKFKEIVSEMHKKGSEISIIDEFDSYTYYILSVKGSWDDYSEILEYTKYGIFLEETQDFFKIQSLEHFEEE
jgi:hypothetical protein